MMLSPSRLVATPFLGDFSSGGGTLILVTTMLAIQLLWRIGLLVDIL